ncbi:MAG: radical SAM protein [Oscillospiraceae bacterium]|nr:radical SAM protein [Oscillospiraceae bacterium]
MARRTFTELTNAHPCFAKGSKPNKGRIHLPVSPGCNISCRFCDRKRDDVTQAPGVSSSIVTPEEAVGALRRALELCPEITVAGIAGSGESLATPYALETFRLIEREFPDIIKCMSTNGLLLPQYADEIIAAKVDTLTVTVNAVAPEILAQIVDGADPDVLIRNQLAGIRAVTAAGVTVKVNTVLIPEINADHIAAIAKKISKAGAKIYNIIPLIPQKELAWCSAPGCAEINAARAAAEQYIPVFRHCQRCRADAAGMLGGTDISRQIYARTINAENTFSHG